MSNVLKAFLKTLVSLKHSFKSMGVGLGLALPWTLAVTGVLPQTPPYLVYGGFALIGGGIGFVADRYITLPPPSDD